MLKNEDYKQTETFFMLEKEFTSDFQKNAHFFYPVEDLKPINPLIRELLILQFQILS